jgi:hypothetical protein
MTLFRALLAGIVAAAATACGGAGERAHAPEQAGARTISGYGMSLDVPDGWRGRIFKRNAYTVSLLRAANFPTYLGSGHLNGLMRRMPEDGINVEVADYEIPAGERSPVWTEASLPIEIDRSDFDMFEGVTAPAFALRQVVVNGRTIGVGVGFGQAEPDDALLAEANRVLAGLRVSDDASAWGGNKASDPIPRIFLDPPADWFFGETSLGRPDPPVPVAWAGNLPFIHDSPDQDPHPDVTVQSLPRDGIVIEVVGPRPYSGDRDLPRLALPLRLADGSLERGEPVPDVSLYTLERLVGGDLLTVSIWLGCAKPSAELIAEANRVLATLSIER